MGFQIRHQLIDLHQQSIYPAAISVEDGIITRIERLDEPVSGYVLPGFVDAHIHIESSMLVPSEFARAAVVHGTVGTVSDPHEIANVLGLPGVDYMIRNGETVPFHFCFGAPSCVPATAFETAGAELTVQDIEHLLDRPEVRYLSEMMNWPGVLHRDPEVMAKIRAALDRGKPVDGHAPGLLGEQAQSYIEAGITTDHECFTAEEAEHKLKLGMKVLIREGSAAKNYRALAPLISNYGDRMMFCSDDKHPDDLVRGHINELVQRALSEGYDLFTVLRMACVHPVEHYRLPIGLLREGDSADFIVVNDPQKMDVQATYVRGRQVADQGKCLFEARPATAVNKFVPSRLSGQDLQVSAIADQCRVIRALDGELITEEFHAHLPVESGCWQSDVSQDVLKLVVVNRYQSAPPAVAFIQGFGLKEGAIASSVAHDSHNVLAVGANDADLLEAIHALMSSEGGLCVTHDGNTEVLPLPVAGLMSTGSAEAVATRYETLVEQARALGSSLASPFMTLSFMALLVIPQLKLSDKGLFDGAKFRFVNLGVSD